MINSDHISSAIVKVSLVLFLLFFVGYYANAQLSYGYDFSKIEAQTWLEFEPDEELSIDGSADFLKEASTFKYYPAVANFFSLYDKSSNSLGLKLSWARLGNHYADIIPAKVSENSSAFLADNLRSMSIWVWSPYYQHELAAIFKRNDGYVYSLKLGKLDFKGWKKLTVKVPILVKSKSSVSADVDQKYFFDRLRIYTSATDKVGNVYVFVDKLEIVHELYTEIYDGKDIEQIIFNEQSGNESSQDENSENSN